MATVNFYYRSKRDDAHLVVRLLFRYDKKDYAIGGRSKILVSKKYWESVHKKQRQTDLALINMQNAINNKMNKLRSHILEAFYSFDNPSLIDKKWLQNQISIFYNPSDLDKSIPKDLVGFIDYYIEANSEKLSTARKKKFITIRNKMERFQKHLGYIIYLKDMNLDWLRKFEKMNLDLFGSTFYI